MVDEIHRRTKTAGTTSAAQRDARAHGALGMIFSDAGGPYFSEVIAGFEAEALEARLGVLILGTHRLTELDGLALDLAERVDGVAILGRALSDALMQRIAAQGVAVVLLAHDPLDDIPVVRADNYLPTLAMTRHLLEHHGYGPLEFLGSAHISSDIAARWEGFREAHRQCGLEPPARSIEASLDQIEGLRRADELIREGRLPRALVCANDELALGVLAAARMHGIRVPEDLAVTGWDNIPASDLVSPTLTTVHQPIGELGATAARSLLAQVAGRPFPLDTLLPTTTIYRGTCGCGGNA